MSNKFDERKLKQTISDLYLKNLQYRNLEKYNVRFTLSIKGHLRWFFGELIPQGEDKTKERKAPKSDGVWKELGDVINEQLKARRKAARLGQSKPPDLDPLHCPVPAIAPIWDLLLTNVKYLVDNAEQLQLCGKQIEALAADLPPAPHIADGAFPGFSLLSLGRLIAEVGDMRAYHNPGALWSMCGLAPYTKNGVTQGGFAWRIHGGLTADEWKDFNYPPRKRSLCYRFGVQLIKISDGRYRKIYEDRRKHEEKKRKDMPKYLVHGRAQRVMVKRLVRDIWCIWRDNTPKLPDKKRVNLARQRLLVQST